ncbi:RES family NAD+ phosphorylase [Cochleicola gelatinilyticus]|uniref:RES domain-containing protein n=1 Tax=Cochleicola gelatinilyticus TaxID=1763537 RepID=A0A167ERG0_9FLAO|nr:RES family NAD+ phosphorylase [Cochleicola gelatinilyticus]OAB75808.1 hypothetical protein ULVI_15135 [Cochleicola gelatinilyticus]
MKIFRIAKKKYITDLSGEGARMYGGRWNRAGDGMLYFSENLSLCVLELLVHMDYQYFTEMYQFISLELPEKNLQSLKNFDLKTPEWRMNPPALITQDYGSGWLKNNENLALAVPSAVLPSEKNILINPLHADLSKCNVSFPQSLDIDARLYR